MFEETRSCLDKELLPAPARDKGNQAEVLLQWMRKSNAKSPAKADAPLMRKEHLRKAAVQARDKDKANQAEVLHQWMRKNSVKLPAKAAKPLMRKARPMSLPLKKPGKPATKEAKSLMNGAPRTSLLRRKLVKQDARAAKSLMNGAPHMSLLPRRLAKLDARAVKRLMAEGERKKRAEAEGTKPSNRKEPFNGGIPLKGSDLEFFTFNLLPSPIFRENTDPIVFGR
jgi:hypothetical protein